MCFIYRTGFEPEASNKLGNEFLIILTLDPSGMLRVTTLCGPRGLGRGAPPHRLEACRSKGKAASGGKLSPPEE
jgi:hypothetical protein